MITPKDIAILYKDISYKLHKGFSVYYKLNIYNPVNEKRGIIKSLQDLEYITRILTKDVYNFKMEFQYGAYKQSSEVSKCLSEDLSIDRMQRFGS